jgi:hypothetical protein
MAKNMKNYQPPTREEIAACAYQIYEMDGRPQGKATEHWLQAEAQLTAERKAEAGILPVMTAPKPIEKPAPVVKPAAALIASQSVPANRIAGMQNQPRQAAQKN